MLSRAISLEIHRSRTCHQHLNSSLWPLQLLFYRNSSRQRAHFAIFVPSGTDPDRGTVIQAVGAPMVGYRLEFERNYSPILTQRWHERYPIGEVSADNIVESTSAHDGSDDKPRDELEREAIQVTPPRISENFRAPVNDVSNTFFCSITCRLRGPRISCTTTELSGYVHP